ncbi:MAG: DUF429 domain-containing protein, partial [Candidatus Omnitrophica bacterium]|nr:DUF429 domain-containing protein [Candidatus Omnitrophota bacterium]
MEAFAGIDVAFAKKKYLPISVCVWRKEKLCPLLLKSNPVIAPPRGFGNAAIVRDYHLVKTFAHDTLRYLREVEKTFGVAIKRIAIDAPSDPKMTGERRRKAELGLDKKGIRCITTPNSQQFESIKSKALAHLENGGEESRIPHANQLWMLVGFELFNTLRQEWECLEVFPQAIAKTLGSATIHKSKNEGLIKQLSATSIFTGWPETVSKSCLKDIGYGSSHDKLDAYLSAWVASLNRNQREAIGSPPKDVIWIPLIKSVPDQSVSLTGKTFENGLREFIEYQLPIFDDILAESQKPLHERPLAAAFYFVDYCIVEIKGDTKENFAEKEWFKSLYKLIKQWYNERYATALKVNNDYIAFGVVLIHKTPFQLNIPLSIAQEKEGDGKRWFCLPISIQNNENVVDWIENKPNLEKMPEADLGDLKKTISDIATNNRAIHVNLMSASLESALHKISSTIPAHLDKAVRDILSLNGGRISTSYWEIHLAIEKAIKLIILQNDRDHQNKHNLDFLCRIANNIRGISLDCSVFSNFPSDNEAIRQRYGEGSSFTIQEAVNNYISASGVI